MEMFITVHIFPPIMSLQSWNCTESFAVIYRQEYLIFTHISKSVH